MGISIENLKVQLDVRKLKRFKFQLELNNLKAYRTRCEVRKDTQNKGKVKRINASSP